MRGDHAVRPGGQRPAGTARVNERLRPLQPRGRGPDADAAIPHYQRAAAGAGTTARRRPAPGASGEGFLPQAATGFPGAPEVTEYISIAESRWRQQLAGLGRTLGVEMRIAFPDDDEPRRRVADFLREAQRLLGGSEIDSAMLQVRKALETIKNTSGWNWPGKKDKPDRTVDERWALIRAAMEDQASGAMHVDPGTRDHVYTRAEVETLIAMTAALLCVTP